jgi:Protein of unknown function (DUF1670)
MGIRSSPGCHPYNASDRKTFKAALCHLLHTEFPGIFGPAVTSLFADKIDELYERFHPEKDRFKIGQLFWAGVAIDDPPCRNKRIEDTRLVPVILDLVTPRDIEEAQVKGMRSQTRRAKIARLFRQAHEQGAVLSLADVSLMIHINFSTLSRLVVEYERETGTMIPRRGTIHDMGRSVTHKKIICYKRLVEQKPTSQVAQETFHSPDEVEYYVQCLRRVQLCRDSGMSPAETAQATGHTLSLVQEYLDLIEEFGLPRLPSSQGKEDSRSQPVRRPIPGAATSTEPRTTGGATAPGHPDM